MRDYDPESISEKIDELRNKNGKDYLDELSPPQPKNKTVSNEDHQTEKLNIDNKKLKEKKVKKVAKPKKTLSTVKVSKPDEPAAKSLTDLGRPSLFFLYFKSLMMNISDKQTPVKESRRF